MELKEVKNRADNVTEEEALEMLEWQSARGYEALTNNGQKIMSDYDSYDNAVLTSLAKQGDPKASQILGDRLLKNGDIENALHLYFKASVRGYTKTIIDSGNAYLIRYNKETDIDKKKGYAMTAYAWFDVASKRGDIQAEFVKKMMGLSFSDEEKKTINKTTNDLYDLLVTERQKLALLDFDNTTPIAITKLYSGI